VEATTPNVPSISGRVVNGLGLMNFMAVLAGAPLDHMSVTGPTAAADAPDQK
jgi:hypothetical protein